MEEEMIENFDFIRLEDVDAWQLPAVYIVYKKDFVLEDNKPEYFIKEVDEQGYLDVVKKLKELKINEWQYDYLPDRNEKIEEEFLWKFIVDSNGRKFVKKGKNKCPENFSKLEDYMIEITSSEDEI